MNDQYFGDVIDFRKYGLLRVLAGPDRLRLGVCWMLTAPDGRTDGEFLAYLRQPSKYRDRDPTLLGWLTQIVGHEKDRRTAWIEAWTMLGCALFQSKLLTDNLRQRETSFAECAEKFTGCDLVFVDPDKGLDADYHQPARPLILSVRRQCRSQHQPDEVTVQGSLNTREQLRECLTVPPGRARSDVSRRGSLPQGALALSLFMWIEAKSSRTVRMGCTPKVVCPSGKAPPADTRAGAVGDGDRSATSGPNDYYPGQKETHTSPERQREGVPRWRCGLVSYFLAGVIRETALALDGYFLIDMQEPCG